MRQEKLQIKNMVCPRCIRVVREDLEKLGVTVHEVNLGEAIISYDEHSLSMHAIENVLLEAGFEILEDREQQLLELIKLEIRHLINHLSKLNVKTSEYLAKKAGVNYGSLSRLFSKHMGITLEKYYIWQKIEKVKELLKYEDLPLEEIAFQLDYSSIAHLSRQFKETTGMTISAFKKDYGLKN